MNIHTYEKVWLIAAMALIVGFIATITYGSIGLGIAMVDDEAGTISPDETFEDERFAEPRVEQVGEDEYEAYVRAQTFSFMPDPIEVPAGSEVTFYVTSTDVIHGFDVVGTNVNTMVIPGEISEMTVEFDEPGEYGLVCNEYCGPYHHDMAGTLVVTPEDEFDMTELSTEAADEVALGDTVRVTASVHNGMLEDRETTVTAEIGSETFEEPVTIAGNETTELEFTVDSDDLGAGDHDWSVAVDGEDDGGSVTITEPNATDAESDAANDTATDTEGNDE